MTTALVAAAFITAIFLSALCGSLTPLLVTSVSPRLTRVGNAFAAGFLVAAALVHLLPPARDAMRAAVPDMQFPLDGAATVAGTAFVFLLDVVLRTFSAAATAPPSAKRQRGQPLRRQRRHGGGKVGDLEVEGGKSRSGRSQFDGDCNRRSNDAHVVSLPLRHVGDGVDSNQYTLQMNGDANSPQKHSFTPMTPAVATPLCPSTQSSYGSNHDPDSLFLSSSPPSTSVTHVATITPSTSSSSQASFHPSETKSRIGIVMVLATTLSVHSLVEGVSLGASMSQAGQFTAVAAAIMAHKLFASLTLGATLAAATNKGVAHSMLNHHHHHHHHHHHNGDSDVENKNRDVDDTHAPHADTPSPEAPLSPSEGSTYGAISSRGAIIVAVMFACLTPVGAIVGSTVTAASARHGADVLVAALNCMSGGVFLYVAFVDLLAEEVRQCGIGDDDVFLRACLFVTSCAAMTLLAIWT